MARQCLLALSLLGLLLVATASAVHVSTSLAGDLDSGIAGRKMLDFKKNIVIAKKEKVFVEVPSPPPPKKKIIVVEKKPEIVVPKKFSSSYGD